MAGPTVTPYGMGVRGNLSWVTDQRPKNFREQLLFLYPNGDAPLTAILSMLRKEKLDEYEFNWWSKALPLQGGAVTALNKTIGGTAYVAGDDFAAGTQVYAVVAAAVAAGSEVSIFRGSGARGTTILFPFTVLILYVVPPTTNFFPTGSRTSNSSAFILPLHSDLTNILKSLPVCCAALRDKDIPGYRRRVTQSGRSKKESDMRSGAGLSPGGRFLRCFPGRGSGVRNGPHQIM